MVMRRIKGAKNYRAGATWSKSSAKVSLIFGTKQDLTGAKQSTNDGQCCSKVQLVQVALNTEDPDQQTGNR